MDTEKQIYDLTESKSKFDHLLASLIYVFVYRGIRLAQIELTDIWTNCNSPQGSSQCPIQWTICEIDQTHRKLNTYWNRPALAGSPRPRFYLLLLYFTTYVWRISSFEKLPVLSDEWTLPFLILTIIEGILMQFVFVNVLEIVGTGAVGITGNGGSVNIGEEGFWANWIRVSRTWKG